VQSLLNFWQRYARRYRWWYLVGTLCLLATNALMVAIPRFVQMAIDALDRGEGQGGALPWAGAILGAGVAIMVVRTLSRTLFFNPGRTLEFRVKSDLFDHLLTLPQAYFDKMSTGDLISRGTNDTNGVRSLVGFATLQLFNVVFTLVLTLIQMFQLDATLTLWCLAPLAVAALVMRYAVGQMFSLFGQLLGQVATLSERILETYSGVGVLQAFNAVPGAVSRFDEANDRHLDLGMRLLAVRTWLLPVVSVTGSLCVVIVLWLGGSRVVEGAGLTLGELTAFIVYINLLVAGITSLGWFIGAFQRGYISLGRVQTVLEAEGGRPEPTDVMPEAPAAGHSIAIRDLTFTHPGADVPALHDVSFDVRSGETLGVFGLTGAGKSTLLDVLARIYEPPAGTVQLSGTDISTVPTDAYWRGVAHVSQHPFLFSSTVAGNIALGVDSPDPARIERAVQDAALDSDVHSFPDGLETAVGERGITVSGGQRQRTALARAFYRDDFGVLLLDDVMSAVDHATEERLIGTLYRRAEGKTTVIVSHRISVLAQADRVIVLDEGRLVDQGTHAELSARSGIYAEAWRLQKATDAYLDASDEGAQ
jgi:ATP-binding cassette, subfamily B, multidrug efflux pump